MTNATAGVKFGGGGYSYGDYSLPSSKKPAPYHEEDEGSSSRGRLDGKKRKDSQDDNAEVFLFTIKDPMRTVISKLMDLISVHGNEAIPQIDIKLAESGPLGYTSMFAFQPTVTSKKMDGLIKPVVR